MGGVAEWGCSDLLGIFDVSTGGYQQIYTDHRAVTVAWSPDGAWVASGGSSITERCPIVEIWERRTGKSVLKIKYEEPNRPEWTDVPSYMDISADKRFLAAGSRIDICVWNTSTRALTWVMSNSHIDNIYSICFSPNAQRIISASYASTIKVWDLSIIGEAVPNFPDDHATNLVCADEDHFAAYYPEMKKIRLWGRRPNIPESSFYEEHVSAIALSQDSQQLALTTFDKTTITIWNISTRAITIRVCGRTEHICFDARDSEESVCQRRHWDDEVADDDYVERQRKRFKRMPKIDSLTFRNASQLFSSLGGLIKIWKTSNGSCSHTIASGHSFATDITFSSQGQRFACLASDGQGIWKGVIQVWDVVTKQCISTLSLEQPSICYIRSLSFSADMQQLAFSLHHDSERSEAMPFFRGYGLSRDREWIVRDGKRLLWIPPDFRRPDNVDDIIPGIDGLSIIWLRGSRDPVKTEIACTHPAHLAHPNYTVLKAADDLAILLAPESLNPSGRRTAVP
ncbi:uncharacterized protein CLUP02_06740 [Colletotrichum lupini]|uniref:WD40 repeat-like protein n=1 Tax=Colletotrichum lupini TaxID=145971 RepID=A0A9Q8SPN9_9PEZI|nr:uncharacterized protein CLUP02_06740 [Colletotrichum lupini]UQC81254.1 hypothetical protein CLUP02_06740 [Colletotrichum lupini]